METSLIAKHPQGTCDVCSFDLGHLHTSVNPTDRTYTFGIVYNTEDANGISVLGFVEEIDVKATSSEEARRLAELLAADSYDPGFSEIRSLPTGGSGGWVTW